jgi:hypothetical protein
MLAAVVGERLLDQRREAAVVVCRCLLRNEAALTISLMGLLAEESLIAQRLGKLGRKKSAAS